MCRSERTYASRRTGEEARRRIGVRDELVVALFGTGHPSRALEYATAAIDLLTETRAPGS